MSRLYRMLIIMIMGVAWILLSESSFALNTSRGMENELYVVETEGMDHAFSAYIYKSVNDSVVGIGKIEKQNVGAEIEPIYSSAVNGKTNFSTGDEAINYVKKYVFPTEKVENALKYASSYASARGVGKITMAFKYDCIINGKRKEVLLYGLRNTTANESVTGGNNFKTSGYLIVNPQPVWVRIIYVSREPDESLELLPNYNQIKQEMINAGILGKLVIDEMNLDGSVAKHLINTQVGTDEFDMPQDGEFNPEVYVSKIIDAYKNQIQADSPLFIEVTYLDHVSIDVDKKTGKLKLYLSVLRRTMYVNITKVGGYSCVGGFCLYISPQGDVKTVFREVKCLKYKTVQSTCQRTTAGGDTYTYPCEKNVCAEEQVKEQPTSNTTTNVFNGPYKCFDGWPFFGKYDEPFPCVELCIGNKQIKGGCAQCPCKGSGPVLNIFTQSGKTVDRNNNGFEVDYGKVRYCNTVYSEKQVCDDSDDGNGGFYGGNGRDGAGYYGNDCHWETTSKRECGDWINLVPKVDATKYETVYRTRYNLGGAYYVYIVSEPLVKMGTRNEKYYAMSEVESGKLSFGRNNIGMSDFTIVKSHPLNITNTTEQALAQQFYYLVVDPFATNQLIDVRNDTINELPEEYYRNWNTTINFVEHFVNQQKD